MADNDDLYESDADPDADPDASSAPENPRSRRALERRLRELEGAQAERDQLRRELEFAKALGTDANDPKMRYFIKGYDGDVTAEAIRSAAAEAGFLAGPTSPATSGGPSPQQTFEAELAAHQRVANASAGAQTAADINLREAIANAGSQDEVLAILERHAGREGIPTNPTTRTAQ